MAQFTVQGRLKLFLNGEGFSFPLEQKDPFHYKFRSVKSQKRKVRRIGFCSSYSSSKANPCNAEELFTFGNGSVYDEDYSDQDDYEFQNDSLACFRGLVLDISYRSLQYLFSYLLLCIWRI